VTSEKGKQEHAKSLIDLSNKRYAEITQDVAGAKSMAPVVASLRELDAKGVFTGPAQQAYGKFAEVMNSFGIEVSAEKLANSQSFKAEVSKMVQTIAKNFPGSQSDRELIQLLASLPSLDMLPAARARTYALLERKFAQYEANYRNASERLNTGQTLIGWEPPPIDPLPPGHRPAGSRRTPAEIMEEHRRGR
jgi:hypothetical protein